ncbi:NUDIX hydrolase [Litchfieldia salsa]|uniref:NUDIX domain-containing protein n=1 Tax=Litchfieldia salsa TaxID=930152 RepID=A0A1H0RXJ1_9BACI|nr:CoA pyrophosphatase [Litchfieldia salsa]SDP34095.1 NUDIX domain-containing protein [Litchfieldia salsa]
MHIESVLTKFKNHHPTILGSDEFSKFSILLPLLKINNETHILFEVRSEQLRRQPGEICFPGGRQDESDETEMSTAIRETSEELGISEHLITDVVPMDFVVSPFGMVIYPFIGVITEPDVINPNSSEVGEVFTVPLSYLLATEPKMYNINVKLEPEQDFPFGLIVGGENYQWQNRTIKEYFYFYNDKVIWGLTAKILHYFIENLKNKEEGFPSSP